MHKVIYKIAPIQAIVYEKWLEICSCLFNVGFDEIFCFVLDVVGG